MAKEKHFPLFSLHIGRKLLETAVRNPRGLLVAGKAFMIGCAYWAFYALFMRRIKIKLPFFVYDRITIRGAGSVSIGSGCSVYPNVFEGLTIITLAPDAQVVIGDGCNLGGVSIRCKNKIEIGERGLFANCLIQDVLISCSGATDARIETGHLPPPSSISVGKGVWLAGQTMLLPGAHIGDEAVVSAGGVCFDRIPARHLAVGNPIFSSHDIKRITKYLVRQ